MKVQGLTISQTSSASAGLPYETDGLYTENSPPTIETTDDTEKMSSESIGGKWE